MVAAVVVLALVAWPVRAAGIREQVVVLLDAEPFECTGTTVGVWEPSEDEPAVPVAEITEDMPCGLVVWVENRSGSRVGLTGLRIPVTGPDGGGGIEAVGMDLGGRPPQADEIDALFAVDPPYPLEPRSSTALRIFFRSQPGCTSNLAVLSFPQNPTVTVEALGLSGPAASPGYGFGFRGTNWSSCDT